MFQLTKELQYISDWLEYLDPNFVDCYNSGLSRQQIDEIIKDLPFKLSEEVYELYQWGNGVANYVPIDFLFPEQLYADPSIPFCRLQDLVYIYKIMEQSSQASRNQDFNYEYWNQKWFPIGAFEVKRILYVVGDIDPSPVYLWDVDYLDNPVRVYKNLTSMISIIAECCESDLYQLIPNKYGHGEDDAMVIRIDEEKLELEKAIYQKYNS
jgi:hypothetical protein